ncbi:hypothetical protein [Leptothoe sp. PORK10 BA2]|uniref:hypothetical protein n=1 Tax=Leptothoe sp. PORK10 BA2 TaxID=3110254 RepID=UPI002B20EF36|nr:hypothetical protein [Leptothoe sp. PORK10 BA2]MEA5464660.1 hypothetical protein [Leptothoe sp. PORK10 BA2]
MNNLRSVVQVSPDSFETSTHFYPRVLNARIHPMVQHFFGLGNERIAERYIHLHPEVDPQAVRDVLAHTNKYFLWGGADLFPATTDDGVRQIIVIETNSCPSGQKSMPFGDDAQEQSGYRTLLEQTFLPISKRRRLPKGELAVLYDKNEMETSGYAAMLADITGESVWWVPCFQDDENLPTRFVEGVLEICTPHGDWVPIRAAFRYVTQRPWTRIPTLSRTAILNPVLVCLSGGRNKLMAAKAYDFYNAELQSTGLVIRTPETIWDVAKNEVPLWVERMGGIAVVKDPYSNAGQGVYTITNEQELAEFMAIDFRFDRFIVQSLVGNSGWSSQTKKGRFYHLGTLPDRRKNIYVADLRMMIGVGVSGSYPVAIYARRAREPLTAELDGTTPSWDMLGTNLSVKHGDGSWGSQSERLMLMDSRDFNQLGIGLDDLIEGYLQTVLSMIAIDKMAQKLITQKGGFRRRLFSSLNPDPAFVDDICSE